LSESAGDAPLIDAKHCIPISMDAEEELRYGRLPARNENWSRSQMIGAAQRFRDHYGRPPKIGDCKAINRLPSPSTIYRVFASFDELILAAGMTPERLGQRRRRWSPVEAAKVCASFKSRHGDWPCWSDVKRYPGELPSTTVMIRFFGSTRSAEVGLGVESILGAGRNASQV
jgi:hypothetical protein